MRVTPPGSISSRRTFGWSSPMPADMRRRTRHARPHSGGEHRPDHCGREVRLEEGLQVLDLRDLVDPPGDAACQGPARLHDFVPAVRAAAETLQSQLGRAPTPEQIAEETGIDVSDVEDALQVGSTVALESPVGEDGAMLGDFIADVAALQPDSEVEQTLVEEALRDALAGLSSLQRRAVELRYGLDDHAGPATMARVAAEIDVPEHQVKPLIDEALAALAERLRPVEDMRAA
jgi:hypothetical protein